MYVYYNTHYIYIKQVNKCSILNGFDAKKADIWSLGVILFCGITDSFPFFDDNYTKTYNINDINKSPHKSIQYLFDLLEQIFILNPKNRISIDEIINHSFCKYISSI